MKRLTLLLAALLTVLCACGPEETSWDRYNQQIRVVGQEQNNTYAAVAGTYVGTFQGSYLKPRQVSITLSVGSDLQPNSGQGQALPVPVLTGSLNFCMGDTPCLQPGDDDTDLNHQVPFTGQYDPQTQNLYLYSPTDSTGGTSGQPQASGSGNQGTGTYLIGKINGDHLTGTFSTTNNPNVGTVDLTKQH